MSRPTAPTWKEDTALLFVVLVWGINFPVLKAALDVMPIHVVNAFRFVVSTAVLGGIYALRQRSAARGFLAPLRTHGLQVVSLGLLGYVFYQLCFIVGVNATTAGNAALIMASAPLWTALLSRLLGSEHLRRMAWIGLGVSLMGTVLVVLTGTGVVSLGAGSLFGNLLMLAAAVLWGAYTAFSKPVLHDLSPAALTFFGLLAALPFLFGIAAPSFDAVAWGEVDFWVWPAIFFSGGLSTGLAYVIWNTAVRNVGPSHTAVFNNLVPFVALLGGVLILGEPVTVAQLAGGALIIGGLLIMRRTRRPPRLEPAPAERSDVPQGVEA